MKLWQNDTAVLVWVSALSGALIIWLIRELRRDTSNG